MDELLHVLRQAFYAIPLKDALALALLLPAFWALLLTLIPRLQNQRLHLILLLLSVIGISFFTLFFRQQTQINHIELTPFTNLKENGWKDEVLRTFLMNVLLFLPVGLFFPGILPQRKLLVRRLLITCLIAVLLSTVFETLQICFQIGNAETDDVLANALGAGIGALHVFLVALLHKTLSKMQLNENDKDG